MHDTIIQPLIVTLNYKYKNRFTSVPIQRPYSAIEMLRSLELNARQIIDIVQLRIITNEKHGLGYIQFNSLTLNIVYYET